MANPFITGPVFQTIGVQCKFCFDTISEDQSVAEHELLCRTALNLDATGKPIKDRKKKEVKAAGVTSNTGGSKDDDYDVDAVLGFLESKSGKFMKKKALLDEKKKENEEKVLMDEKKKENEEMDEKKKKENEERKEEKKKKKYEKKKEKKKDKKKEVEAAEDGLNNSAELVDGVENQAELVDGVENQAELVDGVDNQAELVDVVENPAELVDVVENPAELVDGVENPAETVLTPEIERSLSNRIQEFAQITSLPIKQSAFILQTCDFDLDVALSAIYRTTTTNLSNIINKFSQITSLSIKEAASILEAHKFNLDVAVSAFCEFNLNLNLNEPLEKENCLSNRIKEFAEITSVSNEEAAIILEEHEFNFNVALSAFYDNKPNNSSKAGDVDMDPSGSSSSSSDPSVSPPPFKDKMLDHEVVTAREMDVTAREEKVKAREEKVLARELEVICREKRCIDDEKKAVNKKKALQDFETQVMNVKEVALKFDGDLNRKRSSLITKEIALKTKVYALNQDWTTMEEAMINKWKVVKALEEELLDCEERLKIREENLLEGERDMMMRQQKS